MKLFGRAIVRSDQWDGAVRQIERQGARLRELDEQLIDLIMQLNNNDTLYGEVSLLGGQVLTESTRTQVVRWSRQWSTFDPLISHAINLWTAYGFGTEVKVAAADERAQEVWDAFWVANEEVFGDRDIHELSDELVTGGEDWLALYTDKASGDVMVRVWPTEQIRDVVTLPEDKQKPVLYRRTWSDREGPQTAYYPDYQATPDMLGIAGLIPEGVKRVDTEENGTSIRLMPVLFNRRGDPGIEWMRGWPLCTPAMPWAQAYKQFLTDRAAVARSRASEVEEFRAKGGQRGIEAMRDARQSALTQRNTTYDTNPPFGAGSDRWINQAIETKRLDMTTGAQDAAADSMLLIGQVATALGLPAFMLGRTDMLQNRATAEIAMRPTLRLWNRYQLLWRDVFTDLFNYVLDAKETAMGVRTTFQDRGVTVELSSPLDTDFDQMWQSITAYWDRGVIQPKTLTGIALAQEEYGLNGATIQAILEQMYEQPRQAEMRAERERQELVRDLIAEWSATPEPEQRALIERMIRETTGA